VSKGKRAYSIHYLLLTPTHLLLFISSVSCRTCESTYDLKVRQKRGEKTGWPSRVSFAIAARNDQLI
jgi:hypothetical protein